MPTEQPTTVAQRPFSPVTPVQRAVLLALMVVVFAVFDGTFSFIVMWLVSQTEDAPRLMTAVLISLQSIALVPAPLIAFWVVLSPCRLAIAVTFGLIAVTLIEASAAILALVGTSVGSYFAAHLIVLIDCEVVIFLLCFWLFRYLLRWRLCVNDLQAADRAAGQFSAKWPFLWMAIIAAHCAIVNALLQVTDIEETLVLLVNWHFIVLIILELVLPSPFLLSAAFLFLGAPVKRKYAVMATLGATLWAFSAAIGFYFVTGTKMKDAVLFVASQVGTILPCLLFAMFILRLCGYRWRRPPTGGEACDARSVATSDVTAAPSRASTRRRLPRQFVVGVSLLSATLGFIIVLAAVAITQRGG